MNKDNRPRKSKYRRRKTSKLVYALYGIAIALLILIIVMMLMIISKKGDKPKETIAPATQATTLPATQPATEDATTEATTEETTVPVETEPVMLEKMAELYAQNPDVAGWVRIDGTKLDYPVMFTPEDEEKYLYANLDGGFSVQGLPLIDKDCNLDPESDNLIIYGHNMQNGTAFKTLMSYDSVTFFNAHPTLYYSTLYEERTYEIIAAFYDRVYYTYEDCFKFYQFIDAEDEAHFNEAITYFKDKSLYDTGVTAEFGDDLITLVTCAYHVDNGRFVVVARRVTD